MDFRDYQYKAMRSFKAHTSLNERCSKALLGAVGLAGEVGECTEPVKKWFFHGKYSDNDVQAILREEIGDVLWYVACLASAFDLNLEDIAENNIRKLLERYPEKK